MKIGILQLEIRDCEPQVNLRHVTETLEACESADIYLLPELWSTGYPVSCWSHEADASTPAIVEALAAMARDNGSWICGSLVSRHSDGSLRNRMWALGPDGERPFYDKAHLFKPMAEPRHLQPGKRRAGFSVSPAQIEMSVCYDLRFPAMYREAALDGTNLFLVSSAWPEPRCSTMDLLARARAVENQAFLALCNRSGTGSDGTTFCGGSMVVAPSGEVLCHLGSGEQVTVVDLDVSSANRIRSELDLLSGDVELEKPLAQDRKTSAAGTRE